MTHDKFMKHKIITSCLFAFSVSTIPTSALPDLGIRTKLEQNLGLQTSSWRRFLDFEKRDDSTGINHNPDGTPFLWLPQDTYAGKTFFDEWDFFNTEDPTHGQVDYVDKSTAEAMGLFWVADDGTAFMKADDTSVLPLGVNRSSVRITSTKTYNTGLFILDLNKAPWGCVAMKLSGLLSGLWEATGLITVKLTSSKEYTITNITKLHGTLTQGANWTPMQRLRAKFLYLLLSFVNDSSLMNNLQNNSTNCDANANSNSGCDVVEWSRASYGTFFESQGGGILAMKWDENDISVWSFFRAAIPNDVTAGTPNPSLWGPPSAMLMSTMCNIPKYFVNHSIVFDITFCGDWAGNSYATSGCPGTCPERMTDPTNFENATWSINSLKVYRKQVLGGNSTSAASPTRLMQSIAKAEALLIPIFLALAYDSW
ncbi:hypothetical protein CVT25_012703 [Psilocybe cyanescens]|uniref:GH16 domain-containing protein n=1 Tax=Psilocybe cyanescens TaxID=93625 RepID=A0A409VN20_PSICY|nr:hypothetical protein CVT25_012703 [Psilocybe cyanescens]